jgi:hypothetical protein
VTFAVQRAGRLLIFRLAVVGERAGLAGVVAALSVVSDLARGHPPGEAVRACLLVSSPDDLWAAVVDAEPGPRRTFRDEAAFDEALAGFGDAADLAARTGPAVAAQNQLNGR